ELFAGQALARVRGNEIETGSGPIMATVSMGGVGGGHFAGDSHTVMGRAEEALALAKMGGRDRFASYDRLSDRAAARREALSTANTVQRALRDRRLVLAVEPVVAGPDGSIHFHECLLRMLDDDGRAVPASQFMPAVEELGLVRKVDRHVVSLALTELAAHPELRLSVNISAMTATDASLFGVILSMIESQPEAAARLIVEITETVAMHEFDSTASFIGRLHELGCQVAIDDFGAGFTSFRHLKNLQIDMVKIDSQFIRGLPESAENRLFVEAFLELARSMDVRVVAECVETEAEAAFLRGRGVDYLQGYWFGRPTLERPWGSAPCSAATG
ncbi:MAG TPA: EAL domain-containing protein, partial [Alphaproteobacteria bacterium]|nr:EAL domain-containing protein [Alphaproteobacteria bacterium]